MISNSFLSSVYFTKSNQFSSSNSFSNTNKFSKTQAFSLLNQFTESGNFTKSRPFIPNFTEYKEDESGSTIHCKDTNFNNSFSIQNNATFVDILFLRCPVKYGSAVFIHASSEIFNVSFTRCHFESIVFQLILLIFIRRISISITRIAIMKTNFTHHLKDTNFKSPNLQK